MFWKRDRHDEGGDGAAACATSSEAEPKRWRPSRPFAVFLAAVTAVGAALLCREVVYGPVDRRVAEWRASDEVRQRAIQAELEGMRRPWHIRRLVWHLADDDPGHRAPDMIAKTLARMAERAVEPLYRAASEVRAQGTRGGATKGITFSAVAKNLPGGIGTVVRNRLEDRDRRARRLPETSVQTLIAMGPAAEPALVRLADHANLAAREVLLAQLYYASRTSAHKARIKLAAHQWPDGRPDYVYALGVFAEASRYRLPPLHAATLERCGALLDTPDPRSRVYPLRLLGAVDNPEAVDVLADFLEDGGEPQLEAAAALARHHDARALPVLAATGGRWKQWAGLLSLASLADAGAVDAIEASLASDDLGERKAAAEALELVVTQDLVPPDVRQRAKEAFEKAWTGKPLSPNWVLQRRSGRVSSLIRRARPQGDVYETALERASLVYELGDYAGDEVTDVLVSALSDTHPWVRRAAARSLSRIAKRGSITEAVKPRVREGLEKAKGDADVSVRQAASEALGVLEAK